MSAQSVIVYGNTELTGNWAIGNHNILYMYNSHMTSFKKPIIFNICTSRTSCTSCTSCTECTECTECTQSINVCFKEFSIDSDYIIIPMDKYVKLVDHTYPNKEKRDYNSGLICTINPNYNIFTSDFIKIRCIAKHDTEILRSLLELEITNNYPFLEINQEIYIDKLNIIVTIVSLFSDSSNSTNKSISYTSNIDVPIDIINDRCDAPNDRCDAPNDKYDSPNDKYDSPNDRCDAGYVLDETKKTILDPKTLLRNKYKLLN